MNCSDCRPPDKELRFVLRLNDVLKEHLRRARWSHVNLVDAMSYRPSSDVFAFLDGKTALTPPLAEGLARAFATTPEFWLVLESALNPNEVEAHQAVA